ncbi:hypothetical protein HME9304_02746 [Flagellimonas maritima]|uniref:Uncharacterized protein n=2 Tax=Flagellimonas maritima TaxID=1383885 RepID=A0A2Z4LVF5_9FLAO|nr:hypothetical protein HME9304_02746 [Allomuricauda aurantiaca]
MANAQKDRAELILKNGAKLEGYAVLKSLDKIKFRKQKKADKEFYTFDKVDTLKIYDDFEPKLYIQAKVKDEEKPKVLKIVDIGKNLIYYRKISQGYGAPAFMPGGNMPMTVGGFYNVTNSYVRKPDEDEVTYLASTNWLSGNFKNAASEYFADCPNLVAKIKNRELKKKHLKEIITYYNSKCE